MADAYFTSTDDEKKDPDGELIDDDFSMNLYSIPPVLRLQKYANSDNLFNRQIAARILLQTLRDVSANAQDVETVFGIMRSLESDKDPIVRSELMEQIPHIAMFADEVKEKFISVIPDKILPLIVKFLTDNYNHVRKTSQAALLVLLEQGLVDKADVSQQVCPVLLQITEPSSQDEYRTEAVALLSKMAPLLGKEMSQRIFLNRFAELCLDSLLTVRTVCAANFGDFSSVVGSESTETILLPKFKALCSNSIWGVRKACADVFMAVSSLVSTQLRRSELTPLFVALLHDESRWVQIAAFQALGPFIYTFAHPSLKACLSTSDNVISHPQRLSSKLEELYSYSSQGSSVSKSYSSDIESPQLDYTLSIEPYNSFSYWRLPVLSSESIELEVEKAAFESFNRIEQTFEDPCLPSGPPPVYQFIVPQILIDHFVSMTHPNRSSSIDNEMNRHCAFSLPAVALTLGRSNWPLLKSTYEILASNVQWKVRHSLASSIYELAFILGEVTASRDLSPIFNEFIKDLDEVRIGVLIHLSNFIGLLSPANRRKLLPKLHRFLKGDNSLNWRFRQELSCQIGDLSQYYTSSDIQKTLLPIAFTLLRDKVCSVRATAIDAMIKIMVAFLENGSDEKLGKKENREENEEEEENYNVSLLEHLVSDLATGDSIWIHKKTFAYLVLSILRHSKIVFLFDALLPQLLLLSEDSVPNVRLAVCRVISHYMTHYDETDSNYQSIKEAFSKLQNDPDPDVRYLANFNPSSTDNSSIDSCPV